MSTQQVQKKNKQNFVQLNKQPKKVVETKNSIKFVAKSVNPKNIQFIKKKPYYATVRQSYGDGLEFNS